MLTIKTFIQIIGMLIIGAIVLVILGIASFFFDFNIENNEPLTGYQED